MAGGRLPPPPGQGLGAHRPGDRACGPGALRAGEVGHPGRVAGGDPGGGAGLPAQAGALESAHPPLPEPGGSGPGRPGPSHPDVGGGERLDLSGGGAGNQRDVPPYEGRLPRIEGGPDQGALPPPGARRADIGADRGPQGAGDHPQHERRVRQGAGGAEGGPGHLPGSGRLIQHRSRQRPAGDQPRQHGPSRRGGRSSGAGTRALAEARQRSAPAARPQQPRHALSAPGRLRACRGGDPPGPRKGPPAGQHLRSGLSAWLPGRRSARPRPARRGDRTVPQRARPGP